MSQEFFLAEIEELSKADQKDSGNSNISLATYDPVATDEVFSILLNLLWIHLPIGLVSNTLVLTAVVLVRKFHSPDNLLLAGLAVCDLLECTVGTTFLWMVLRLKMKTIIGGDWVFCNVSLLLTGLFAKVSLSILSLVGFERFIAVVFPFRYQRYKDTKYSVACIVLMFLLNLLFRGSFYLQTPWDENLCKNRTVLSEYKNERECNADKQCAFHKLPETYRKIASPAFNWTQVIIGLLLTMCVAYIAWKQLRKTTTTIGERFANKDMKNQMRHVKIALILMFLYIFLWFPTLSISQIKTLKGKYRAFIISKHFLYINGWINIFVYAVTKPAYFNAFKYLLTHRPTKWGDVNSVVKQATYSLGPGTSKRSTGGPGTGVSQFEFATYHTTEFDSSRTATTTNYGLD